jgi:hypothetical protein
MTYPLDQIVALAEANGRFFFKLTNIAQSAGEDYARIGNKAATAIVDQFKQMKPGTVPIFKSDDANILVGEAEQSREASLAKLNAAFDEWRGCCKDALSQTVDQDEMTRAVQRWFQPLFNTTATKAEKVKPGSPTTKTVSEVV